MEFDEVVIGAGLTGLVYGNVAAAEGRRVAIVEKHVKPGGYATNFKRRGEYVFDCSLHKITGMGSQGNLEDALVRAGLWDQIEFHEYRHLTNFIFGESRYSFSCDGDAFRRELEAYFPHEREGIARFFSDVCSCGRQNYMLARASLGEYEMDVSLFAECRRLRRLTTYQYLCQTFSDPVLTSLFCALAINLGVETYEVDALYFLHFAYTFFLTRKCYVKGSSQYLADTLAASFLQRGGVLLCGQRVLGIDTNGLQINRVRTRRHELECSRVVFTGCPHQITELLPRTEALKGFEDKLSTLEFGLGAVIVYLGLNVPAAQLGFTESDYLIADENYLQDANAACDGELRYERWPLSISNYSVLDPAYGNTLQLGLLEPGNEWLDLPREAYREKKQRVTQSLIDRACRYFPQLRDAIRYVESSTPHTNRKYTLSGGGSAFGYKPVLGRNSSFLARPPVEGLEFVGTWVNGAGYEPAMCLGFTAATLYQRRVAHQKNQYIEV